MIWETASEIRGSQEREVGEPSSVHPVGAGIVAPLANVMVHGSWHLDGRSAGMFLQKEAKHLSLRQGLVKC